MIMCVAFLMTTILVFNVIFGAPLDPPKDETINTSWELLKNDRRSGLDGFQQLARALQACGLKSANSFSSPTNALTKVMLSSYINVTCNDGSPSGYYIRRSIGSKRWIIFLEGGWYCFDKKSCDARWTRMKSLMTSKVWPELKHVGGILSADPEENPYWWNANHVFIPYCSSDSWSGTAKTINGSFAFMGSLIIEEVIKDLFVKGLFEAKKVYLAGSSAGGTGVLLNLDRVADMMRSVGSRADVRGIADSGWFIDNKPFQTYCSNPHSCSPMEAVKKGIKLWSGRAADRCQLQHPNELWKCYLGYHSYPSMQAPLFVFQWLFDEAQMTASNVGAPVTKAQWNYVHKLGQEVKKTLENVTAVFAPACISHSVLTKREWKYIKINSVTLPQAIRCWEEQKHEHNHHHHHPHHNHHKLTPNNVSFTLPITNNTPRDKRLYIQTLLNGKIRMNFKHRNKGTDDMFARIATNHSSRRNKRRRRNRRRRRKCKRRHRNRKKKVRHGKKKSRSGRSMVRSNDHARHRCLLHRNGCNHHLVEKCSWPQCNPSCPKLRNPFTGEEMNFLDLLKSFGLNMEGVATALGIDMATLNEMDHGVLLQLLTQQDSLKVSK